jgi:hypothetical protein
MRIEPVNFDIVESHASNSGTKTSRWSSFSFIVANLVLVIMLTTYLGLSVTFEESLAQNAKRVQSHRTYVCD